MRHLLLVISLLLSACATDGPKWTESNEWTFGAVAACNLTDAVQTHVLLKEGYEEGNPLVGSHPSDAKIAGVKAAGIGVLAAVEQDMDSKERNVLNITATLICTGVVLHNYNLNH